MSLYSGFSKLSISIREKTSDQNPLPTTNQKATHQIVLTSDLLLEPWLMLITGGVESQSNVKLEEVA